MINNDIIEPEYNKLIHADQTNDFDDELIRFEIVCSEGLHYGYPKCCILHYYHNYSFDNKKLKCDNICKIASGRTGFIPCYNHSIDIIEKRIKIGELIDYKLRRTIKSFPRAVYDISCPVNTINYFEKEIAELYNIYMEN
jgi:hypothetical protein